MHTFLYMELHEKERIGKMNRAVGGWTNKHFVYFKGITLLDFKGCYKRLKAFYLP